MSRRGVLVAVACGIVVGGPRRGGCGAPGGPAVASGVLRAPPAGADGSESLIPTPTASSSGTEGEFTASDPSPFLVPLVQIMLVLAALIVLAVIPRLILSLWRQPRITLHEDPGFEHPEVPVELLRSADQRTRPAPHRRSPQRDRRGVARPRDLGGYFARRGGTLRRRPRVHRAGHRHVGRRPAPARRPRALYREARLSDTSSARRTESAPCSTSRRCTRTSPGSPTSCALRRAGPRPAGVRRDPAGRHTDDAPRGEGREPRGVVDRRAAAMGPARAHGGA